MRLILLSWFLLIFIMSETLLSQHFLILGGGYSAILYTSESLDEFTESYNNFNRRYLSQPLDGIDNGIGFRLDIGYRYLSKWHFAGSGGYISYVEEDLAKYTNGERRRNKFEHRMMYLEGEAGIGIKNFFINGILGLYFNRNSKFSSDYISVDGQSIPKPLNGVYKNSVTIASDIGIAIGLYRHPFFLVAKVTIPVFTGGSDEVLRDERQSKVEEGTDRFPRNFADLFSKDPYYEGVKNDIDGIKISILLSYAIKLD
jgi:hypothetical protein